MTRRTPAPVALVPFSEGALTSVDDLLRVAAALNVQAVRDLAPIWDVSTIVAPFLNLEDVPPGYDVIAIIDPNDPHGVDQAAQQTLGGGLTGLHFLSAGTAVAIIEGGADWSLHASHELMEMVCDRAGDRVQSGPPLVDASTADAHNLPHDPRRVDYLVEVCDPCQHSTYTIDGVLVSDFVTPGWYSDAGPIGSGAFYSFTGRITQPRTLLTGGYVTWATQAPKEQIWQAIAKSGESAEPEPADAGEITIGVLYPARMTREWIDAHPPWVQDDGVLKAIRPGVKSRLGKGDQPLADASRAYEDAAYEAKENGAGLRAEITQIRQALSSWYSLEPGTAKDVLGELRDEKLTANALLKTPGKALQALQPVSGRSKPSLPALGADPNIHHAPPLRYQEAINAFDDDNRFGSVFSRQDLPGFVYWCLQMGTVDGGNGKGKGKGKGGK